MSAGRIRPTRSQLAAARDGSLPDLVAPDLAVLLVGINPGLWSAAVGRHFGNPANRLWPVLHRAGFTSSRLGPDDADELLSSGIGITNMVNRATATAAELGDDELRAGADRLRATLRTWRPRTVAFLGLQAYRVGFGDRRAAVGRLPDSIEGVPAWLLPNPSGLNAHYQLPDLVRLYSSLREAAMPGVGGSP